MSLHGLYSKMGGPPLRGGTYESLAVSSPGMVKRAHSWARPGPCFFRCRRAGPTIILGGPGPGRAQVQISPYVYNSKLEIITIAYNYHSYFWQSATNCSADKISLLSRGNRLRLWLYPYRKPYFSWFYATTADPQTYISKLCFLFFVLK